jgi:hypothetical protein
MEYGDCGFGIADCRFKNKKSGVRIQNSGEKHEKLSSSKLVADYYWILSLGGPNFILQQMTA